MSDASSYTSLLDLVANHLTKYNVEDNINSATVEGTPPESIPTPFLNDVQSVLSNPCVISPEEKLSLPKYCVSDSPIEKVLADQISNMVKARERKEQKERQRLEQEMNKLALQEEKDNEYVIDLLAAIQTPVAIPKPTEAFISSSSSFESLLLENNKQFDEVCELSETEESLHDKKLPPVLPCKTDISYVLKQKVNKVKCSPFGKVLTARLRPVAAPYLKVKIQQNKVIRFDFNTKSPCDLIKEKLQQPTSYNTQYASIMDIIMGNHENI